MPPPVERKIGAEWFWLADRLVTIDGFVAGPAELAGEP